MSSSAIDKYCHRRNEDGTFDSICRSCFLTVATTKNEDQLDMFERQHVCDISLLQHLASMRIETS